jgi:hypothetical protein
MDATNAANSSEPNRTSDSHPADADARNDAASITAAPSYDEPYRFGRQPTSRAPFPFTEREFARLLIVRGRVHAARSQFVSAEA